jgi:hypothetical protein
MLAEDKNHSTHASRNDGVRRFAASVVPLFFRALRTGDIGAAIQYSKRFI